MESTSITFSIAPIFTWARLGEALMIGRWDGSSCCFVVGFETSSFFSSVSSLRWETGSCWFTFASFVDFEDDTSGCFETSVVTRAGVDVGAE